MNLLNISGQPSVVSMGLTFYRGQVYSIFGGVCPLLMQLGIFFEGFLLIRILQKYVLISGADSQPTRYSILARFLSRLSGQLTDAFCLSNPGSALLRFPSRVLYIHSLPQNTY